MSEYKYLWKYIKDNNGESIINKIVKMWKFKLLKKVILCDIISMIYFVCKLKIRKKYYNI